MRIYLNGRAVRDCREWLRDIPRCLPGVDVRSAGCGRRNGVSIRIAHSGNGDVKGDVHGGGDEIALFPGPERTLPRRWRSTVDPRVQKASGSSSDDSLR